MTEFKHTDDMGEISGFGGGYEAACQNMLSAGVKWLNEHQNADRAENDRLRKMLAAEELRNETLCKRLDAERSGDTIAHCYDPEDWEYTFAWEDRDEVHGHGENLTRGKPMLVFTLLRGPRKWVAEVPVTFDEDGDWDETEFRWFDSEEEARAALAKEPRS